MTIAQDNNIKKGRKIIKEINVIVISWAKYAKKADVGKELWHRIQNNLNTL